MAPKQKRSMSSENPSARHSAPPLAYRLADDATAAQVAAVMGAIWLELDAALAPIVGPRGVAALGQRSLHLASTEHPWLAAAQAGGPVGFDPVKLWPLLAQRSREEATGAGSSFLHIFHGLLSSLIGPSLTERLLRAVWGPASPPA